MGISLKKEKMIEYLEKAKAHDETFRCMLWGTVHANLTSFQNRSAASVIMFFAGAPGISGSLSGAFCYIGLTEKSLYVVALDAYNTSKITGTFCLPFTKITSLSVRKAFIGVSHIVQIECGDTIRLTVKGTSIGTDIKDQKERMAIFLSEANALKNNLH